ncbi:MAG: helix-turn-helix domain-containing protein, partial [Thermoanaerobaculia bacterium]
MRKNRPGARALALQYLRAQAGWSQKDLAERMGLKDVKQISRYENGSKSLRLERLHALAAAAGSTAEAVEILLVVHELIASASAASSPMERRRQRAALAVGAAVAEQVRRALAGARREVEGKAERARAEGFWERLKRGAPEERRQAVCTFPEYGSWALAVRACEASIRAAANRPGEALELAELALEIARRVPGDSGWRSRVEGFCWAHVGNARRVANDLAGANTAFSQAWALWKRADSSSLDSQIPEWRMLDLEASLRRAECRFAEALELLTKARAGAGNEPKATARILLNREHILMQMGDLESAFAALVEAAPLVEASGDRRLFFSLRFKTANNLVQLGDADQAFDLLAEIRDLAVRQANELDLIRVTWLEGRIRAGQGRRGEAIPAFEQVSHHFTSLEMPYDAALASLDLAIVYLQEGRHREVM